ncbi:MAG: hypothetical protein MJ195_01310 [Mycoplasmoidaceae bacterium]|nr:hypothetical protein [Mycoplasmoidaceae bacterium]
MDDKSFNLPFIGTIYVPTALGFEGIQPLNATRLRGYTDQVPIGTIRSKEILSARDVYLEAAQ